jgi:branched-chain amino acid transport system permease protein
VPLRSAPLTAFLRPVSSGNGRLVSGTGTSVQGVIFVICVLTFRRGIIGEIARLLKIKL